MKGGVEMDGWIMGMYRDGRRWRNGREESEGEERGCPVKRVTVRADAR